MIKKTNILSHTYSKSDLPMNQNVETSACLHNSCFGLQFKLYWKISFPLEFSNIAYNVKCNTEYMKTAIFHFAKWNSVQAIASKNVWFCKTLFLRKKIILPLKFEFSTQFSSYHTWQSLWQKGSEVHTHLKNIISQTC